MFKLPTIPANVAKIVSYGEGYAEWIIQLALLIGALIPNDGLSTREAAILAVITRVGHAASGRLGQAIVIGRGLGISPVTPKVLAAEAGKIDDAATTIVPQAVKDAEHPNAEKILADVASDEQTLAAPAAAAVPPPAAAAAPAPVDILTETPDTAVKPDVPAAPVASDPAPAEPASDAPAGA